MRFDEGTIRRIYPTDLSRFAFAKIVSPFVRSTECLLAFSASVSTIFARKIARACLDICRGPTSSLLSLKPSEGIWLGMIRAPSGSVLWEKGNGVTECQNGRRQAFYRDISWRVRLMEVSPTDVFVGIVSNIEDYMNMEMWCNK